MKLSDLVGKRVESLEVDSDEQHYLRFTTNDGIFCFEVEGECCSESWFADIIGVDCLLGGTIATINEIEMDKLPDDGRGREEEDLYYSIKITTNMGVTDIIWRNSSNGYYGGSLVLVSEVPGEVNMKMVTEDYKA
jgi:hypothetical protein